MFITEKDIDQAFKEAGVVISDKECSHQDNHIHPKVFEYLEKKWNRAEYEKENEKLEKLGKELLREIDE